jgi:hypothetical protein
LTEKESAISTISKNMKKLYQMPQNKKERKQTLPLETSGPFEHATDRDLRKSQLSDNISRDISQINQQLTPKGHQ